MENPVCNPITETNREVPSFENVFIVFCAIETISAFSSETRRFIRNPTKMDTNRIPAMPSEIPLIRILPIAKPVTTMKNRRLIGERNNVSKGMMHHQIPAYAEGGYRDTASEFYRFVYRCDSGHKTRFDSRFSFLDCQAKFLWIDRCPA